MNSPTLFRLRSAAIVALLLSYPLPSFCDARLIQGIYRNSALGFSVKIPQGLRAVAGGQSGPERGVAITTPSGGTIVVFGEPNSLGWQSPAEGVRYDLSRETEACRSSSKPSPSNYILAPVRLGDLANGQELVGAQGTFTCSDRFVKVILVFRPGGGPIYWLHLATTTAHETEANYIDSLARSFTLIGWH